MPTFKIKWSELSLRRIEEHQAYIEIDSPMAAKKWTVKLISLVKKLANTPYLGRKVPEFNVEYRRELIFGNFRIIYDVDDKVIEILTIQRAAQLLNIEED
jgi:toxin ParE1/3/4